MNRAKRTLQANVIEAVSLANEANALKAEVARMRPVFDASMVIFEHKRHGLKGDPNGFDCEGGYWILRANWRDVKAFRAACARASHQKRKT